MGTKKGGGSNEVSDAGGQRRAERQSGGPARMEEDLAGSPVVQELRALDDEYLLLEQRYRAESLELDRKFEQRYTPLLEQRSWVLAAVDDGPTERNQPGAQPRATPAVPGFWKTVLQNSAEFQEDIEEYDEPVLDYLSDIRHEPLDDRGETGFRLILVFGSNPFFSNVELAKVYHTERENEFVDRLDCVRIDAPKIDWRPGKNVTVELVAKKAKGGGRKKQIKAKREEVSRPSFFRIFFRNLGPDEDILEEELENLDEDEEDDTDDLMDSLLTDDFERAVALREYIVPHAVRWYTGEACDEDDDDYEEDEEEEEEEETEERSGDSCSDGDYDAADDVRKDGRRDGKGRGGGGRRRGADVPKESGKAKEEQASDCKGQ